MNPLISHALIGLTTAILGFCTGYAVKDKKKYNLHIIMNISVVILSIVALAGLLVAINQYRAATSCQSIFNTNFVNVINERGKASDDDRHATRVMLDAILSPSTNQETRLKALQDWQKTLQETDNKRNANPIPLVPECAKNN